MSRFGKSFTQKANNFGGTKAKTGFTPGNELADKLDLVAPKLASVGYAIPIQRIAAELRHQPQSVNAELLRDKERLDWCESQGSKFNAEGNYPGHSSRSAFGVFENERGKTDQYWEGATFREAIDRARAESVEKAPALSKEEWIGRYGGQALLDSEGFEVVRCVKCDDRICCGWRVQPKSLAQPDVVSGLVNATPQRRRPLDDHEPDGYLESDNDYVLNNLEWCMDMLDRATGGDLTARSVVFEAQSKAEGKENV